MSRNIYYVGILFGFLLGTFSPACLTRSGDDIPAAITAEPSPSLTVEQTEDLTDDQFAEWQTSSLQPVFRKWLDGENIDGKFIELGWNEEALKYIGPSQREAHVALLDLDGDGRKELAVQTGCATVGNCVFLLFRRHAKGYQQVLDADMVHQFGLRKSKTHGYFDLETRSHGSSTTGGIDIYKFDGKGYRVTNCYNFDYNNPKGGKLLKKPILERRECWENGQRRY